MKNSEKVIDWESYRKDTKNRANYFISADESKRTCYIGGEIIESAVICNAWGDNIHEVAKWLINNGRGLQPTMAKHLIGRNT